MQKENEGYDYIHCRVTDSWCTDTLVTTRDIFAPPNDIFKDGTVELRRTYAEALPCDCASILVWLSAVADFSADTMACAHQHIV